MSSGISKAEVEAQSKPDGLDKTKEDVSDGRSVSDCEDADGINQAHKGTIFHRDHHPFKDDFKEVETKRRQTTIRLSSISSLFCQP